MADKTTDKAKGQEADDSKEKKPDTSKGESKDKEQSDNKKADDGKDSSSDDDDKDDQPKGRTFTQKELDGIITKRLTEEKDRQRRDADAKAAKEKGEFEKLSNQYEGELKVKTEEYDKLKTRHDELNDTVNALLTAQIRALPEAIRELKPETDDSVALLKWLTKAQKAAAKSNDSKDEKDSKEKKPGNGADPKAASKDDKKEKKAEELKSDVKKRFGYKRF